MGNCFLPKPKKKEQPQKQMEIIKSEDFQLQISSTNQVLKAPQKQKEDTISNELQQQKDVNEEVRDSDVKNFRNEKKNKRFLQAAVEEDTPIVENILKIPDHKKSPSDYQLILNALEQHYFFNNISQTQKEDIIFKMYYAKVKQPDDFIFKQGDQATSYFIVSKGSCQVIINNEFKRTLNQGVGFGELALLYGAPRSASVKALGDCELWGIDRGTFRKAVEEMVSKEYSENRKFIDGIKFFDQMNIDQKDKIAGVIITQQFKKGDFIVNEGDMASSYFIIKMGTVSIQKGGKELRKMTDGDSFGEQALYVNSVRGATAIAESEKVICLALGRETITKILGDKIQVILYNNILRWSFEKNSILSKLTKLQLEKIVTRIENLEFQDQEIVFEKDKKCDKIAIVLEGQLKQGAKIIATKGGMIGEFYIPKVNREKLIEDNIIMFGSTGRLGVITFEKFFECIGGEFEQVLTKNENNHEKKYIQKQHQKQNYDHIQLQDMIFIKKLGFGQFGSVYLVRCSSDKKMYALKCIQKNQVIDQHLEKHLIQEKSVLEVVQFPFIMQFIRSLKDNNNIYFLVEYIKGMELFDVIREIGLLNTFDSQFFIGSIILCMEYLHGNNIIYRDIKPENIMVDHQGFIKLIDMGTAKFLKGGKNVRTFTIIGTPHYMAPEIITGKGYTFSIDIWSLGVCLYEFMCGGVPFAEDAEDPYEIYEEVIKKPLSYPSFLKDKKAKKLMDQLINKTPEIRLGGSFAALKANGWFDNFDWDKLMDREIKPPYIPPKEKMINDKEIQKLEGHGKLVLDEIKGEQGKVEYKREKAKDPNWDQQF